MNSVKAPTFGQIFIYPPKAGDRNSLPQSKLDVKPIVIIEALVSGKDIDTFNQIRRDSPINVADREIEPQEHPEIKTLLDDGEVYRLKLGTNFVQGIGGLTGIAK